MDGSHSHVAPIDVGHDVRISPLTIFRYPELAHIGDRVAIDDFTLVTTGFHVGSFVHIASHCSIIGGPKSCLIMEDFTGLSAGCRIICATDDFKGPSLINPMVPEEYRTVTYTTVRICRFATLGTNAILLPGVTIGEGAVVAAGGLVGKDLDPWGIYAGSPVRRIGTRPADEIKQKAEEFLANRIQP